jgi:hypothetical protein
VARRQATCCREPRGLWEDMVEVQSRTLPRAAANGVIE